MKYCVDANVFITAWHTTYPPRMFPSLYRKMESVIRDRTVIIKPIFDEIENFSIPKAISGTFPAVAPLACRRLDSREDDKL